MLYGCPPPVLRPVAKKHLQVVHLGVELPGIANDFLEKYHDAVTKMLNFPPPECEEHLQCFSRGEAPNIPAKNVHFRLGPLFTSCRGGGPSSLMRSAKGLWELLPSLLEGFFRETFLLPRYSALAILLSQRLPPQALR